MRGPGLTGPITEYRLRVRWEAGFPSELEQREAARFAGLKWEEYQELPGTREVAEQWGENDSKCDVLAHYRMTNLFDAVMGDLNKRFPEKR